MDAPRPPSKRTQQSLVLSLLAGALLLAACRTQPGPAPTAVAPTVVSATPLIAFESTRDGNLEIYVIDAEGAHETNLTNHPARDYAPEWSPDGTRLAFISDRSGKSELYMMAADGSGLGLPARGPQGDHAARKNARRLGAATQREQHAGQVEGDKESLGPGKGELLVPAEGAGESLGGAPELVTGGEDTPLEPHAPQKGRRVVVTAVEGLGRLEQVEGGPAAAGCARRNTASRSDPRGCER